MGGWDWVKKKKKKADLTTALLRGADKAHNGSAASRPRKGNKAVGV